MYHICRYKYRSKEAEKHRYIYIYNYIYIYTDNVKYMEHSWLRIFAHFAQLDLILLKPSTLIPSLWVSCTTHMRKASGNIIAQTVKAMASQDWPSFLRLRNAWGDFLCHVWPARIFPKALLNSAKFIKVAAKVDQVASHADIQGLVNVRFWGFLSHHLWTSGDEISPF